MRTFDRKEPSQAAHYAGNAMGSAQRERDRVGPVRANGPDSRAPEDPAIQLRKSTARAATDVASLEQANRSGDAIGALLLRRVVERFVADAPARLAATRNAGELETQVRAVVERGRSAIEHAPKVSPEAMEAAHRGDTAQWNAELAPWLANAGRSVDRVGTAMSPVAKPSGSPLPTGLRGELEPALGASLSHVRIHTDADSASAADALHARAFATGQDIHFGAGQYDPSSPAGRHLIAHEVAHTVQQQGAAPAVQCKPRVSEPGDAAEHQAERFANAFVTGQSTQGLVTAGMQPAATIHRYGRDEHAALSTTCLIDLYDYLHTPEGKKWALDHGYANPEQLIQRIEADPVVKTHKEPLKPGERANHVAKLRGKSTQFSYGELTAMMGDLFGSWNSLYNATEDQRSHLMGEDSTASNEKYTNGNYVRLAANNENHFAVKNQETWLKLHTEAIEVAKQAGRDDKAFNQALFIEAASTHFLTDAFSSGHQFEKLPLLAAVHQDLRRNPLLTENREMQTYVGVIGLQDQWNIPNLIVKAIHDRMNAEGFDVVNGKGMKWRTVGDGNLAKSPETQRIAALAVFESRQQIFEARRAGDTFDSKNSAHVQAFLPNNDTIRRANSQAIGYISEARKQVEQIVYHERKTSKSKLGEVGGYLVEHNIEAIGDPQRERDILQRQDFDRRQGGSGAVPGSWFEWRWGK